MKQIILALVYTALIAGSCKKNNDKSPIEQLPPETQTGANTFGCLIDGKAFIPKGDPFGGPIKKAFYQFVNGKYVFGISARRSENESSQVVGIGGDSIQITVGAFDLASVGSGKMAGGYTYRDLSNLGGIQYGTTEVHRGQLVIKKFDTLNQIVSGTFWFDAINASGQKIEVREGRFDLPYVR